MSWNEKSATDCGRILAPWPGSTSNCLPSRKAPRPRLRLPTSCFTRAPSSYVENRGHEQTEKPRFEGGARQRADRDDRGAERRASTAAKGSRRVEEEVRERRTERHRLHQLGERGPADLHSTRCG